jgi:hypothetical protein
VRYWAALWLLLVSALIPREAEAHDGLPISVVIEERADGLFRLDLALPPSVPEAQRPQVRLIPDCAVKGPRLFGCPQGLDARKVELVWPSGIPSVPVLARVTWKDGQSASVLGAAGQSLLALPAREHPGSVFLNYFRIGIAHILFGWDHLACQPGLCRIAQCTRRGDNRPQHHDPCRRNPARQSRDSRLALSGSSRERIWLAARVWLRRCTG